MLINVNQSDGVESAGEIPFSTPFGYMFLTAVKSEYGRAFAERTEDVLLQLGDTMAEHFNVSQLHAAILTFSNTVKGALGALEYVKLRG